MSGDSRPSCSCAGRAAGVLVGLFATWQLVSIPAANLMTFVPQRRPGPPLHVCINSYQERGTFTDVEPLQRAADRFGLALELWGELSGEEQGWSLFSPGPPPYSVFVATEFEWPDGTRDTLLSQYEPPDLARPPHRAPLVRFRDYYFEVQFVYPIWYASPEVAAERPHLWADVPVVVHSTGAEIRAWLRRRTNDYLAANPDRPRPSAVVLKHRFISTPRPDRPGEPRTIEERPYARWRPDTDELEAFDLVAKRYVSAAEVQP